MNSARRTSDFLQRKEDRERSVAVRESSTRLAHADFFRDLAESSCDAIIVFDLQSRPIYANAAAARMFDCAPEELVRNQDAHPALANARASILANGRAPRGAHELVVRHHDGSVRRHEGVFCEMRDGSGAVVAVQMIGREVAPPHATENVLARSLEAERLLTAIARAFLDVDLENDLESATCTALELLGAALEAERITVLSPNESADRLRCTHRWSAPGVGTWETRDDYPIPPGAFARADGADETRHDETSLEPWLAALRRDSGRRVLYAPIGSGGRVLGLISVHVRAAAASDRDAAILARASELFAAGWSRRAREDALARAKDDALARSAAKSSFLANMSHELRIPLSGVLGMVDLLSATKLDARQSRYAKVARTSANLLMSVIDDILDFSKIEAKKLELDPVEFSFVEVVENVVDVVSLDAERKGIVLAHDTSRVSEALVGDAKRLHQVLLNLVGNAVKFTYRGRVDVTAGIAPGEAAVPRVRVEVRDTGTGVPASLRPSLFQPFASRRCGGTGLGLAICRELVEHMGGCIGVESVEGKGSTFWFEVPLARAAVDAPVTTIRRRGLEPQSTLSTHGEGEAPRARVLVVEDSAVNAEVVSEMLRTAGYDYDVVRDGFQAIRWLRNRRYDLVLMDCQLPELDGYDATMKIRALEADGKLLRDPGFRLPIVGLTASATKDDFERCRTVGMDDCLAKPVAMRRLLGVVGARIGPTHLPPKIGNLETALTRLQGNRELLARMIRQFVTDAAESRVRLREAYEARDARALARRAHRLRGQAAAFEAVALLRAVERLEEAAQQAARAWAVAGAALLTVDAELDRLLAFLAPSTVIS